MRFQLHELNGVLAVMHRLAVPEVEDSKTVTPIDGFHFVAIPATAISLLVPKDGRIVRSLHRSVTTKGKCVWRR